MAESEKTVSVTIPPPVLGWNTKDPISEMGPLYSPGIENYFPANGTVDLRKGYTQHVKTASGSGYYTLSELVDNAASHFLIGFVFNGDPYNVTSSGAGTAITGGFSCGSPEVYTVNFAGRLFAKGYVNNIDMLSTDGTAATRPGFTGPGGDDKTLWRLTSYKGRLYALSILDASMWYGGFQAVTGAMAQYDFQSFLTLGGIPWFIGPFAMSNGDITQEYFCVVSNQGEVLLYQGDNPGDDTWYLVGHYFIAAPVGRKSFFNWGTDLLVVSYDGLISLRDVIGTSGQSEFTALSDNISGAFKDEILATVASGFEHYITGIVYPKGQYLLINFNDTNDITPTQFVMNTRTRAWTKFTGQAAICWSLLSNNLYWGGFAASSNSYVAKADDGFADLDLNNSVVILNRTTQLRFAFNYFDDRATVKTPVQAVPVLYESEGLSLTLDCDIDYSDTTATSTVTDTTDPSYKLYKPTCGLTAPGPGKAVSIRLDGSVTTKRRSIQAVEVYYKSGGIR